MNLDDYTHELKNFFYNRLDGKSTAVLYGSAVCGDWTRERSDIDVAIFLDSSSCIESFEAILTEWQKRFGKDLLDGFLLFKDQTDYLTKRFYNFSNDPKSLMENVLPPDIWQIKNRGKYIFGSSRVKDFLPDQKINDLKEWARANKASYWIPTIREQLKALEVESSSVKCDLTAAIWITSGAARIKTLEDTGVLSSKRDAIKWFSKNNLNLSDTAQVLLDNYDSADSFAPKMNKEQVALLYESCLKLLLD